MLDRNGSSARERVLKAMKPSDVEMLTHALPDGASENFRFLPTPVETRNSENDASTAASGVPAEGCAIPTDDLTPRQRLAISALLCGGTLASVAARIGVSGRTLYTWRQQPAFAAELRRHSSEAIEANATRARNLMLKSTQILAESLQNYDRQKWAYKLLQSRRLWEIGQTLPEVPDAPAAPLVTSESEAVVQENSLM